MSQFNEMTYLASPVKFSSFSKFHVNIIASSEVMIVFFYTGLIRNPESRDNPVWVCPISVDWNKLGIPNLVQMFLINCSWMLYNARVISFTVSELLRENLQERRVVKLSLPTQIRVKTWKLWILLNQYKNVSKFKG